MRITTLIRWLLACLLSQVLPPHLTSASATATPSSSFAGQQSVPAERPATRLEWPDDGPRYDPLQRGQDALQFHEALVAFKRGEYEKARIGFEVLVKLYPQSELMPGTTAFLAELVRLEDASGRGRAKAIDRYRGLMRAFPTDPNASRAEWRIGDLYVEMGWHHEARVAYEHALSHASYPPDVDRAMLGLGFAFVGLKQTEAAAKTLESLRKRTTDDRLLMWATLGLAKALSELQRKREAGPLYAVLNRRWPDLLRKDPAALFDYGTLLLDDHRPQEARAMFGLLYNLYPAHQSAGAALVGLGDCSRQLGMRRQAELFYMAAQSQYAKSRDAAAARMRLAKIDQEAAVSAGDDLLRVKVGGMMRGAATSYLEASEIERVYRTAAAEYDDDILGSEAVYRLAEHHESTGEWAKAIRAYQELTHRTGKVAYDPWPRAAGLRLTVILKPWLEAAIKANDELGVITMFHRHGRAPEEYYAGTDLLLQVAETHRRLGFSSEAVHLYQTLLRDGKAAPLHEQALIGLGRSYLDQGDPAASRKVFERYRLQYPLSQYQQLAVKQLTTAMLQQGDRQSAIRLMRQWLQGHARDPERGWMQVLLAKTLAQDRQTAEAMATFEEASRRGFLKHADDVLVFADLLTQVAKRQRAVDLYQQILAARPERAQAEWARLQIARNLSGGSRRGPARTVLIPGGESDDPLLRRAAAAFLVDLRPVAVKEGE